MKKIVLIICFGLFFIPNILFSQSLNIKYKIDTVPGKQVLYNIHVEIVQGTADYSFALLDNDPWNNGKVIEKITITESKYTFRNVKSGKYYLCAKDGKNSSTCNWLTLE
jgi:hypothetical protein